MAYGLYKINNNLNLIIVYLTYIKLEHYIEYNAALSSPDNGFKYQAESDGHLSTICDQRQPKSAYLRG